MERPWAEAWVTATSARRYFSHLPLWFSSHVCILCIRYTSIHKKNISYIAYNRGISGLGTATCAGRYFSNFSLSALIFMTHRDTGSLRKSISIKHDLARSCFQFWLKIGDSFFLEFCHPRSRFWEPKLKTWFRQIMFYVIYPELWKLLKKMKIL